MKALLCAHSVEGDEGPDLLSVGAHDGLGPDRDVESGAEGRLN